MSDVLITGGLGFIGSHVAREFTNREYDVVLMDITDDVKLIKDIKHKVKIIKGSVTDKDQVNYIFELYKPKVVVHYAALLSVDVERKPTIGYQVNFDGTWNVFEAARKVDADILIFASSIAAYGPGLPETVEEDVYTIPQTLYGISKRFGEMLGMWFSKTYGIKFIAFRYASVIGPGRRDGGASAYSTLIIQKAAQGEPYMINVPEDAKIPIVYVKDVADVTVYSCENIARAKSKIYNVASLKKSPSAIEIVNAVRKVIPNSELVFKQDAKTTEIIRSWPKNVDIKRIEHEVLWRPKYADLDVLVADFISEVKAHPDMFHV